jgi:proline racemase
MPHENEVADRADLVSRYRQLVLHELPRRAAAEHWVVRMDHCFGRIVLDHAVGGCWYDVLDRHRSPAFAQLDDAQLRTAVSLAEQIVAAGDPLLRRLNDQSLRWRGHPPARSGTSGY